jgi:hypothetical protein
MKKGSKKVKRVFGWKFTKVIYNVLNMFHSRFTFGIKEFGGLSKCEAQFYYSHREFGHEKYTSYRPLENCLTVVMKEFV